MTPQGNNADCDQHAPIKQLSESRDQYIPGDLLSPTGRPQIVVSGKAKLSLCLGYGWNEIVMLKLIDFLKLYFFVDFRKKK